MLMCNAPLRGDKLLARCSDFRMPKWRHIFS
jgi:hypothetical protein